MKFRTTWLMSKFIPFAEISPIRLDSVPVKSAVFLFHGTEKCIILDDRVQPRELRDYTISGQLFDSDTWSEFAKYELKTPWKKTTYVMCVDATSFSLYNIS